jgi:hypothetical protein
MTKEEQRINLLKSIRTILHEKKPHLMHHIGFTLKGLYMHNPLTGFNELIDSDGKFTGQSPY